VPPRAGRSSTWWAWEACPTTACAPRLCRWLCARTCDTARPSGTRCVHRPLSRALAKDTRHARKADLGCHRRTCALNDSRHVAAEQKRSRSACCQTQVLCAPAMHMTPPLLLGPVPAPCVLTVLCTSLLSCSVSAGLLRTVLCTSLSSSSVSAGLLGNAMCPGPYHVRTPTCKCFSQLLMLGPG
jgi:hypothetical protein